MHTILWHRINDTVFPANITSRYCLYDLRILMHHAEIYTKDHLISLQPVDRKANRSYAALRYTPTKCSERYQGLPWENVGLS